MGSKALFNAVLINSERLLIFCCANQVPSKIQDGDVRTNDNSTHFLDYLLFFESDNNYIYSFCAILFTSWKFHVVPESSLRT